MKPTAAHAGLDPAPDGQEQPCGRQWTSTLPQVASEDVVAIGNGRYAHFRRDRRFAQVQVTFTAPEGVDPNPGRELTDQFKEMGWTWRPKDPGKPWTYQLEKSSEHDPTARGDSRDALHEQFLLIIQEYREQHGLPPTLGWQSLADSDTEARNPESSCLSSSSVAGQAARASEDKMPKSAKAEARAGGRGDAHPAQAMLDTFASVGAERFDITFTDAAGKKVAFRGNRFLDQLRPDLPAILQQAGERQHNVIVRPRSTGAALIQLDDLGEAEAGRLQPVSFLILRTSPGNYQAWVAVSDADADFARRLRKGAGADLTASGATRVSGSLNFKEKYAPAFPHVETVHASPGKVVTPVKLEALGVVAPAESVVPAQISNSHRTGTPGWPSYQQCLEHPNAQKEGRPDRSKADFAWCVIALDWGWGIEDTADRLMEESGKAQENGPGYALRTARAAARVVEGRGGAVAGRVTALKRLAEPAAVVAADVEARGRMR